MTSNHDDEREGLSGHGLSRRKVLECMTWAGTSVLHPHMTGTIVVEAASGSNPAP